MLVFHWVMHVSEPVTRPSALQPQIAVIRSPAHALTEHPDEDRSACCWSTSSVNLATDPVTSLAVGRRLCSRLEAILPRTFARRLTFPRRLTLPPVCRRVPLGP